MNIGLPVVRTDGRAVLGHVITKFSGMGRFTQLWGSALELRARGAPLLVVKIKKRIGFFNQPFLNILHSALCNAGFFFTLRAT